jgi:hypothetical protein
MAQVLRHVYVKEDQPWPSELQGKIVFHISGRDEGTGLDIWWWEEEREDDEPPGAVPNW